MDWMQLIVMLVAFVGLFLWVRAEGRSDMRHAEILIDAIRQDIKEFHREFHKETKDFHGRLCELQAKSAEHKGG